MSNGNVVFTNKDDAIKVKSAVKLVRAELNCFVIDECIIDQSMSDYVRWIFSNEDDAIRHANIFMNMGFEYVRRIV